MPVGAYTADAADKKGQRSQTEAGPWDSVFRLAKGIGKFTTRQTVMLPLIPLQSQLRDAVQDEKVTIDQGQLKPRPNRYMT